MGELGGKSKKRRRERASSVGADRSYLENSKEAKREAQGAEGLDKNGRKSVSPSWSLINGRNKHYY